LGSLAAQYSLGWIFHEISTFPAQYPEESAQYRAFFDRFKLLKRFLDGGYEIRIYRVDQ
jgi:hypothetical protein